MEGHKCQIDYAVILAAGQGTRMKSKLYKVLHPVCGKPMVQHVVDQVSKLNIAEIVTVIGHGAEKVQAQLGEQSQYALQEKQLGYCTCCHAGTRNACKIKKESTFVVCGDTPLIKAETMEALFKHHEESRCKSDDSYSVA